MVAQTQKTSIMKTGLISSVLTIMFAQDLGITDNTDLMRANILAMEIENNEHTIDSIKETSAYRGCHYDIPFNEEFLQSLLDKKQELIDFYNETQLNALENQSVECYNFEFQGRLHQS